MAEPTGANPGHTGEPQETVSLAEYKKLQREIAKREKESAALRSQVAVNETRWDKILAMLGNSESLRDDDKQQITAIRQEVGQQREQHAAEAVKGDMESLLNELGVEVGDFNDSPRFEAARAAYLEGSVRLAKALTRQAIDLADPEAIAERRYQEKLKAGGKVDTGTSTAAGGGYESYMKSLAKGGPLPSSEEIDRIVAEGMKRQ